MTPIFRSLQNCQFHHRRLESLEHLMCLIYIYIYPSEHPSLFVFSVCAYCGVVGYFRCFSFMCEFCFLYCDDVRLSAVY